MIMNLEYIFEIEPPGFDGRLDVGCNTMKVG